MCVWKGKGLVIAVSSSWPSSDTVLPNFNPDSEILAVKILHGSHSINRMYVYSSSGNVVHDMSKFGELISGPPLSMGDFNLHHPLWGLPLGFQLK